MNIWEYLSEPQPWVDTSNYTLTQILIFFSAAMMWVIVYIDAIIGIIKKKTLFLPVIAICLNFGYEVTAAFFYLPDMGMLVSVGYWLWFLLDLFIIVHAFKYGHKQIKNAYFKKHFKAFMLLGFLIAFTIEYFYMTTRDIAMAPYDAYIINFVMSVCFLYMVFIPGYEGNSMVTAWFKFLGTGWTSVMFQMRYPDAHFLSVMYVAVAIFDILYIYLLYQKKRGKLEYAIQ
ncbi:MAG: hypothetical protein KDC11_12185 [Chitinophagaceae bacterium]|nr:hypothetical protein [Chitinophagaceae bacterium]